MTLTKPATTENLALFLGFVEFVADRHGLAGDRAHHLKLVVEEAVANIVHHGYAGRDPGELTLSADVDGDAVVVTLDDHGHAFDPAEAPPANLSDDWQERSVGGLGWHLIRELTESVSYTAGDAAAGRPNRLILRVARSDRGGAA